MAQLSDDLVASDLTQAIVLAGVRHEEVVAQFDEGPKRRSRWSECKVAKKGKRWGLPDDKPYKPLCYVDLPMGLSQKEIDQFLREQRLEDLHRKIQGHELEDHDPDIRPPSPPPIYDKAGNRLNTRDIRIRKAMTAEYNRLIRYMIKHVEGYLPPVDWKPAKLMKKIIIPIEKFPQAPFMGVIIGPRGVNHKRLQETTGCKIFIRGRDIGDKWQSDEEAAMPQHVHIEGDTEEQILTAERLIEPLLNPESPEFEYARTHGMQQLAMVNGFSLNKAEQRCGICGALGHLGFECPETNTQNYKMANVVCTICGDKGHVASDCKKTAEANKRDNMDWKVMAEKKAQMDKNFSDLMTDMNNPQAPTQVVSTAMEPAKSQAQGLAQNLAAAGGAGSCVDKSIVCPSQLVSKLIGANGTTIKKLATDSGAQINMDQVMHPGGGKAVVITAADPVARERAKMLVNMWIKENSAGLQPPGLMQQAPQQSQQARPQAPGLIPSSVGGLRPVAPMGAGSLGGPPSYGGAGGYNAGGPPSYGGAGGYGGAPGSFPPAGTPATAGMRPGGPVQGLAGGPAMPTSGMGGGGMGMGGPQPMGGGMPPPNMRPPSGGSYGMRPMGGMNPSNVTGMLSMGGMGNKQGYPGGGMSGSGGMNEMPPGAGPVGGGMGGGMQGGMQGGMGGGMQGSMGGGMQGGGQYGGQYGGGQGGNYQQGGMQGGYQQQQQSAGYAKAGNMQFQNNAGPYAGWQKPDGSMVQMPKRVQDGGPPMPQG